MNKPFSARESMEIALSRSSASARKAMQAAIDRGALKVVGDDQKPDIIVGGDWPSKTLGGRRATCHKCGAYVGLSPHSAAAAADRWPDVPIECWPCAQARKADT